MDGASGVSAEAQHTRQRVQLLAEQRNGRRLRNSASVVLRNVVSGHFSKCLVCVRAAVPPNITCSTLEERGESGKAAVDR